MELWMDELFWIDKVRERRTLRVLPPSLTFTPSIYGFKWGFRSSLLPSQLQSCKCTLKALSSLFVYFCMSRAYIFTLLAGWSK